MSKNFAGAKWWSFDFHTHTPASHDYKEKNITPRAWLLNFMQKEIDCVAITDHNTGAWIDVLRAEAIKMEAERVAGFRKIFIFAGVEISVHGGVHLLAIFDESKTSANIATFLGAVGFTGTHGNTNDCTSKSFEEVASEIFKYKGIAIPAHADQASGLFVILQGITLEKSLKSKGLLGVELIDPNYTKPGIYNELGLHLAEVVGSDSHDSGTVGRGFTWIKMETPSFEALKLALHDGEDGVIRSDKIKTNPNEVENSYFLKKIIIKDGHKAGRGRPLEINFSPWLTTLIGGRGSGKSSIFNYLRIAMNKTDDITQDILGDFKSFNQVGTRNKPGMLTPTTEISVHFYKDKRNIELLWKNGALTEYVHNDDGTSIQSNEIGDVKVRFPLRIFSQKQLLEMTKNSDSLIQLIDSQWKKREWSELRDKLNSEWISLCAEKKEVERSLQTMNSYTKELEDVNLKIKLFEDSGHKDLLEKYNNSNIIKSSVQSTITTANGFLEEVKVIVAKSTQLTVPDKLDNSSQVVVKPAFDKWNSSIDELKKIEKEFIRNLDEIKEKYRESEWFKNHQNIVSEYQTLVKSLEAAGEKDPQAYDKLIKERSEITEKIDLRGQLEVKKEELLKRIETKLAQVNEHQKVLREERQKVTSQWNLGEIGTKLKVILHPMGNIENAEKTLREIIRKQDGEFAKDIFSQSEDGSMNEGLLSELRGDTQLNYERANEKRRDILKNLTNKENSNVNKRLLNHIDILRERTPEDLHKLAIWFPDDSIQLQIIKGGETVEIESGSAGERTAAMLALLLSIQNQGPLLIDQPEDDLDTRLISELVVSGIRKIKLSQQLIVITHNPNIPVNAAAEKIVELKYSSGQIVAGSRGGLQRTEVRNAVCEIMEGGKVALDKRYYRISQALQNSN